jgi:hypothetical protein
MEEVHSVLNLSEECHGLGRSEGRRLGRQGWRRYEGWQRYKGEGRPWLD